MEKRGAGVVLCIVALVTATMVGVGLSGSAAGARHRANKGAGDYLQAAGYLLGSKPSVPEPGLTKMQEDKIHINAKIHCDNVEPGDHLHIHSGSSQYKASDPMAADCQGEGDSGFAEGFAVPGTCNGQMAFADYRFDDNPPEGPILLGSKKQDEDEASITVTGAPGCNMEASGPFQGNIEFKDKGPDPTPSSSAP